MRQPRNFATDRCCHLVSRIANRAFYLSAEAGGWRTTFLRFSPKGQGGRSRFATCSDSPVRTTSRRSTLRRCARRATLHRLARRIRIRLGWSTRSRRRGVGRSRMGRLLHHSPLHQRTLCSLRSYRPCFLLVNPRRVPTGTSPHPNLHDLHVLHGHQRRFCNCLFYNRGGDPLALEGLKRLMLFS